jgi:hypothetical protein
MHVLISAVLLSVRLMIANNLQVAQRFPVCGTFAVVLMQLLFRSGTANNA